MIKRIVSLTSVLLAASLFSCGGKGEADRKTGREVPVRILATVNGVPITEYDLKQGARRFVHDEMMHPGADQAVLETLVRSELIYQQSIELGLDKNEEYRNKLYEAEAQLRAFQRQEMSALYRNHIKSMAAVTDAEAREYFEKNSNRIQTKYHVWQIYYKGEQTRIAAADEDLKSGMPFEKAAARRFPPLPQGMKDPWDLGYLYWNQIPPSWQAMLDRLEPGQTSDIVQGPNKRFWIIKLVDKRVDPAVTFETEKAKIVEVLQKQKADDLHDAMITRMRMKSKIIFPE